MKLIKIEPNQGMSFKIQWVNASLRMVLFINIFLICSVILSQIIRKQERRNYGKRRWKRNLTGNCG